MKSHNRIASAAFALVLSAAQSLDLHAQTGYYNTDRGRPTQVEDASVAERYAMELKLAPLRLERAHSAGYTWQVEPELAYGILPRTQIEISLPLVYYDHANTPSAGIAGLELSAMHNLNAETEHWPALGIRGDLLLPVGSLSPHTVYPSLTAIATRTQRWARIHLNVQITGGQLLAATSQGTSEISRWLIGTAIDKTFPLRSILITGEIYARQPYVTNEPREVLAGIGSRKQLTTTLTIDAGLGSRLTGSERGWYVTFGSTYAFAIATLMPEHRE